MSTKLTLRLDESLIANAKTYAEQQGHSVSQLVADYFVQLKPAARKGKPAAAAAPITASLRGALRGTRVTEADYRKHLEAKHK
ncbi:MAG: antitoxin [Rhodocyclales bacterium]|nr:antitoxin [Rhodocyclales bacterium]